MRFLKALIIVLVPQLASAQLQVGSIDELLRYADEHAPAIQQAAIQPKVAKQDKNALQSAIYPKVSAFGTGDYYPIIASQVIPGEVIGKPGTYVKAQFGLPYVFVAGAELSMPLINLERWAQVARSRVQYNQSVYGSKAAIENMHMQLLQSYYQLLVTRQVLGLNDENEGTSDELLRIMTDRNKQGVVNPADLNRTKNLQLDVVSSGIGYRKSLEQLQHGLTATLNLGNDSLSLTEDISKFNWPVLQSEREINTRPAWEEAQFKVRVAEMALRESRGAALPKLAISSRYTYNVQSKFEANFKNVEFSSANIGARLDVPLFQGSFYRSGWHKNKLLLESARLERERTEATLKQQHDDWYSQYNAAFKKQHVLEEKVKNASDNLRIAKLNIREGLMEFDEFNNIFMEYNRARMEQIQNLADGILYYLLSTQKF